MSDLVNRLNGIYRIKITDGLGPAGGEEPNNPDEFVRTYETSPIQKEAAARIAALEAENKRLREALKPFADAHDDYWREGVSMADLIDRDDLRRAKAAMEGK